jgi:hypothetical protein
VGLGIDAVYNEFVFQRGTYSLRNEWNKGSMNNWTIR